MSTFSRLESDFDEAVSISVLEQEDAEAQQALSLLWTAFPDLKLNNIQITVFVESWKGKTYNQIAESELYDADYIKDVGHRLWKLLSDISQQSFSKYNFRSILKQQAQKVNAYQSTSRDNKIYSLSLPYRSQVISESQPVTDFRQVTALRMLYGRSAELLRLEDEIIKNQNCLIGVFGLAGVGKTALVMHLSHRIESQFEFVIGRSLRNTPDFESFIKSILHTIQGKDAQFDLPPRLDDQIELLIDLLSQRRCLLILDDWISILESQDGIRTYRTEYELYGLLLRRVSESQHQSCVLVTSREAPAGLVFNASHDNRVSSFYLKGFNKSEGLAFLHSMDLLGTDLELENLWQYYDGNPFAMKIASRTIINIFNRRVANFLEKKNYIYGEIRQLIEQQFKRISEFERSIVLQLSLMQNYNPEGSTINNLEQRLPSTLYGVSLIEALESLYHRSFLCHQGSTIFVPRILQGYVLECIHDQES